MSNVIWALERIGDDNQTIERYRIDKLPCVIGRGSGCDLQLTLGRISRRHARLDGDDGQLLVGDLDSTNGTFVDGHRIENETVRLPVGKTLHLGEHEFRLVAGDALVSEEHAPRTSETFGPQDTVIGFTGGPAGFPVQAPAFYELLNRGMIECGFLSILKTRGGIFGYECLVEPSHPKLMASMEAMFALAEGLDESWALAELCCTKAIQAVAREDLIEPVLLPARVVAPLDRPGEWLRQTIDRETSLAAAKLIVAFDLYDPGLDRAIDELIAADLACCVEAADPSDAEIKRLAGRVSYLRLAVDSADPSVARTVAACRSAGILCIADAGDLPLDADRLRELGIELYLERREQVPPEKDGGSW